MFTDVELEFTAHSMEIVKVIYTILCIQGKTDVFWRNRIRQKAKNNLDKSTIVQMSIIFTLSTDVEK